MLRDTQPYDLTQGGSETADGMLNRAVSLDDVVGIDGIREVMEPPSLRRETPIGHREERSNIPGDNTWI